MGRAERRGAAAGRRAGPPRRRRPRSTRPSPRHRRAAAGDSAWCVQATSCRSRVARSGAVRARRPARSPALDEPPPGHGPRPDPGCARRRRADQAPTLAQPRPRRPSRRPPSPPGRPVPAVVGPAPDAGRPPGRRPRRASRRPRPRGRRRAVLRRPPTPATMRRSMPRRAIAAAIGRMPGTERTSPPSDNSPMSPMRPGPGRTCSEPEQDAHRHRQVQARARLAQLGRGQIDRDPPRRVDVPGVADGPADPFAGLLERRVREADDGEPGQSGSDVHLDSDGPAFEAEEGRGRDDGQHPAILAGVGHRPLTRGSSRAHPRAANSLSFARMAAAASSSVARSSSMCASAAPMSIALYGMSCSSPDPRKSLRNRTTVLPRAYA